MIIDKNEDRSEEHKIFININVDLDLGAEYSFWSNLCNSLEYLYCQG